MMIPRPTFERVWLNGDLIDIEKNQYFCDRCDLPVPAEHFKESKNHVGGFKENVARYESNLSNWEQLSGAGELIFVRDYAAIAYRPCSAINLIEELQADGWNENE